jgi:hypothetical protein
MRWLAYSKPITIEPQSHKGHKETRRAFFLSLMVFGGYCMSIWGAGNFENDDAGDFMSKLVDQLHDVVKNGLTQPNVESGSFLERYGEGGVIPAIATLIALKKQLNVPLEEFEDEDIQLWKEMYLRAYDNEIRDEFDPNDEYCTERRDVIAKTFDELATIVEQDRLRHSQY